MGACVSKDAPEGKDPEKAPNVLPSHRVAELPAPAAVEQSAHILLDTIVLYVLSKLVLLVYLVGFVLFGYLVLNGFERFVCNLFQARFSIYSASRFVVACSKELSRLWELS